MWRSRCVGSLRSNSAAAWNRHESLTVDTVADAKAPKRAAHPYEEHMHGNA
jgi:hypothetical protein